MKCFKCKAAITEDEARWDKADGKGRRKHPLCANCDLEAAAGFLRGRVRITRLWQSKEYRPKGATP